MLDQSPAVRTLPPGHGLAWLLQCLLLMRAQPVRLLLLALVLQLVLGLTQVPVLGLMIIIAMPALSAGLLQGFHQVALGQRPAPGVLFAPLSAKPLTGRLLGLGALMFGMGLLIISLVMSGSDDLLDAELIARIEQGDMDAIVMIDPAVMRRVVMAVVLGISVSGTLSFMTIPLIWFRRAKVGVALLCGLRALVMNWKPFLLLSVGISVLIVPAAILIGLLFQMVATSRPLALILLGVILLAMLAFQLLLFGTQYCAFREIFGFSAEPAPADDLPAIAPPPDDDQFVA